MVSTDKKTRDVIFEKQKNSAVRSKKYFKRNLCKYHTCDSSIANAMGCLGFRVVYKI